MAIHSISMWRTTLDNVAAWTASSFLLHSLVGYQAAIDDGGFADREQCANFLQAWRLAKPPGQLRRVSGPTPILDGRVSVEKLRKVFSKISAAAAADLLVENYLSDPVCGFSDSVAIIASALTAFAEVQLADHGIGVTAAEAALPVS